MTVIKLLVMGNLSNCQYTNYREHPAYGYFSQQPSAKHIFIEKRIEKSNTSRENAVNKLEEKKRLSHESLVKLTNYMVEDQPYCYRIILEYPFINKTLAQRAEQVEELEEEELQRLISDIQSALKYLNKCSITHANVSKDTILFDGTRYFLTDSRFITNMTSYQKTFRKHSQQFLSEKLMCSLKNRAQSPLYSLQDDLFALGMVVLAAVTSSPTDIFYDKVKCELRTKVVENKLRQMSKVYSSKLVRKVKQLISGGMDLQATTSNSLCESLDNFNQEFSLMCSKLRSYRVLDL